MQTLLATASIALLGELSNGSKRGMMHDRGNTPIGVPMMPELAREIERAPVEAGLSVEETLRALREQRKRYYAEKHTGDEELR